MAGHHVPVAVDVLHVHRHVHGALAAIDEHGDAPLVGDPADLLDRNDRAECIRHVGDGDELGLLRQALLEVLDVEGAVVVDRDPYELRALPFPDEMPGDDVGVMLHDGEDDLVALADIRHAPAVGDGIDRLGG